jgi:hypothetical protein
MAKTPSREEIELRAYEIYLEHGGQDGNELEHWLAAEKELADRSSQSDVSSDSLQPSPKTATAVAGIQQRSTTSRRAQA